MEHHIYFHFGKPCEAPPTVQTQLTQIMADLTQLTADVASVKTVAESAITLIQGLKAQLDAAGTDPAKLAELSASLESTQAELAAALTANTPAATSA